MTWPGPVFYYELIRLSRQPRNYLLRFVYGAVVLLFLWMVSYSMLRDGSLTQQEVSIHSMASYGEALFTVLSWIQSITLLLLTPAMVAGVIAEERQRKTLDYLLTSCLSRPEIVLGKLFARLTLVGVFLAIGLPIMAINTFFGGIDPNFILLFFLASASSTLFLGTLAMAVSASVQRPRDAISLTYVLEFCWLFLPTIVWGLLMSNRTSGIFWDAAIWIADILSKFSPFYLSTPFANATNQLAANMWMMIGLQSVGSAVLLGIATLRIRPTSKKEGSSRGFWKRLKTRRSLQLFKRPECFDDAMLWKELFCSRKSLGYQMIIMCFFVVVGGLAIYSLSYFFAPAFEEFLVHGYSQTPGYSSRNDLSRVLRVMMGFGCVPMVMMAASSAANSFAGERERDTWVSLIASPLTAAEMIRAKAWASVFGLKWLLGFLYATAFLGMLLGAVHPMGIVLHLLVTAVHLGFAIALGLYFSLRSRTSTRAMGFTIGTLLALNLGPVFMVALLYSPANEFLLTSVAPFVEALALIPLHGSFPNFRAGYEQELGMIIGSTFFTGAYLITTMAIFAFCVERFDAWNDRPSTNGA